MSLLISGGFFVFVSYVMAMGVHAYPTSLDKVDAPLNVLAQLAHVGILQVPLSLGAMISFFVLCLSCLNAGSRILYVMGRDGIFPPVTAMSHTVNETPHVAVTMLAVIAFLIPLAAWTSGIATLDLFNYAGTCAAFGFLVPYALITVAAPMYLRAIGQLKTRDMAICIASLLLLAIPVIGSVYPVPSAPVNAFRYPFLAYLAVGLVWILAFHRRRPSAAADIRSDLQSAHDRFIPAETAAFAAR